MSALQRLQPEAVTEGAKVGLAVMASLPAGLALVSAEGRVIYWNARAADLLMLSEREILSHSVQELYHIIAGQSDVPADRERALVHAGQQHTNGARMQLNLPNRKEAGILDLEWFPIPGTGYGLLLRDVTREKESEAMKSQLLSTVSHEFRTPLASIKGFASTLLREDVQWDIATQRDFLRIIEEETDRLSELIDNLLDMSQIEVGMLRVVPGPTQLRTLVREVAEEMRMRTEQHWFVVDMPAHLPRVWADARRLRQVLRNLFENALKYSPRGGQITVSCQVEGDQVQVSVSDQGDGIPPEYLDRIFERFFQVDGTSTRKIGGSGLGLSIAKGIVEAHGGRIWAESSPGYGSVFRFTVPLAPEDETTEGE